jgi:hypothetical protein
MPNSPELKALIRKNAHLFWYTKDSEKENLPLPVVVEFFLNYGEAKEIKKLFATAGIHQVAKTFNKQIKEWGERSNYLPVLQNYYSLYFDKYASTSFK